MNEVDLIGEINKRTKLLDDIVRNKIVRPVSGKYEPFLRFVIARKWNSWYPSYFNTHGGCYAFITRDSTKNVKDNSGVIVIDPGFDFLRILRRNYGIEPYDLRTVIVSHYHPDHTMGLFELLTLTNEAQCPCSYYFNKATYDTFKSFQGKYNTISELTENQILNLGDYTPICLGRSGIFNNNFETKYSTKESIIMRSFKTFHGEIGNRHTSLGFDFHIIQGDSERELVILGDTDGNEKYIDRYLDYIKNSEIVVLHLGSYSEKKYHGNKHLYKSGLIDVLNCINCVTGGYTKSEGKINNCLKNRLRFRDEITGRVSHNPANQCPFKANDYFHNLKLVIISELGLEMADTSELVESFGDFNWIPGFKPFFLLAKIIKDGDFNGPGVFFKLLSTKAIISIKDFMKTPSINAESYLLSFAMLFGIYFVCRTISVSKQNNNHEILQDLEDLITDLNIINYKLERNSELTLENFAKYWLRETNIKARKNKDSTYILNIDVVNNLKDDIENYYDNLINNICFDNLANKYHKFYKYDDAIVDLLDFIELIISILIRNSFSDDISSMRNEISLQFMRENIQFIRSISLIDLDLIDKIDVKFDFKGLIRYKSLVCLTLAIMHNYIKKSKKISLLDTNVDLSPNAGLKEIIDKYQNNDKRIKFFLTDLGIELDLSNDLRIRSSFSKWTPIENAEQVKTSDGKLSIIKKNDIHTASDSDESNLRITPFDL
jgi:hypothetical protein